MDPIDPALQSTALKGVKPFLTLIIFDGVGSFSLGALLTAFRRATRLSNCFFKSLV